MWLRLLRGGTGLLVIASGALMYAAAWQRWAGACPWGDNESRPCTLRQDHLYDFVAPSDPWQPVGDAAELAGWSLLLLALVLVLLPWAMGGRRPGIAFLVGLVAGVLATAAIGVATVQSGASGSVVHPVGSDLVVFAWLFVPPVLMARSAVGAGAWAVAAAVCLVLGSPLVAAFTYAIGPYDAQPWWEAIAGALTATGGLCLLLDAALRGRFRRRSDSTAPGVPGVPAYVVDQPPG